MIGIERILATGGAGFLGTHLCERLVEPGLEALCVGDSSTGSRSDVASLLDRPNFEAMRRDVTVPLHVEVDEIHNLACPASPIHDQRDPAQTTGTSVIGAIDMLGLAKRCGAKVFRASTSRIHGDPDVHPQVEGYRDDVRTIGPLSC